MKNTIRQFWDQKRPADLRAAFINYLTLFARDFGSLVIQTVYFLLLANTLALADMGIFAAIMSLGMIIGSSIGLGYEELSYRAAIQKPRLLGHYLAGSYFVIALTLPPGLILASGVYMLVFAKKIALFSFLEVIIVDLFLWRMIEVYALINEGLGRFGRIVKGFVLSYSLRALAALLFWKSGQTDLVLWIHLYLAANILAFGAVWLLYRPKARLRLDIPMTLARLGQSSYMSFTRLMYALQREIDKLIILVLSGSEATGIYTISLRILALIAMPVSAFFSLYIRKILKRRASTHIFRDNIMVEGVIFGVVIVGFFILMQILDFAPNLLGKNVAAAHFFYSSLIFLPAFRILLEFHSELYFAFNHIRDRALASVIISITKTAMMTAIVMMAGTIENWPFWMNAAFALLYLLSLGLIYPIITGRLKSIPALLFGWLLSKTP